MSNINATLINENFPVPGVDNDTVGFRDNFATIKNNFSSAKTEIESLTESTAKVTDSETDFRGNMVSNAVYKNSRGVVKIGGTIPSFSDNIVPNEYKNSTPVQEISFTLGEYQHFSLNGFYEDGTTPRAFEFQITDIPSTGFAKLRLELLSQDGQAHNVTIASGNLSVKKNSTYPGTLTISSSSNPTIIEISTRPSSGSIFLEYKGVFA